MSLKYEPASEMLHSSARQFHRFSVPRVLVSAPTLNLQPKPVRLLAYIHPYLRSLYRGTSLIKNTPLLGP